MKKEFTDYLDAIGINGAFYERVVEIHQRLTNLLEKEITDIFVSDYIQEDGTREYENLQVFVKGSIIEVDQFLTNDEIYFNFTDKCPFFGWRLKTRDYNYKKATKKSRMTLRANFGDLYIDFKAAQENCDYLYLIVQKYFIPETIE